MSPRLRVLILSRRWPPFCGGAERQMGLVAGHLANGHMVKVIRDNLPQIRGLSTCLYILRSLFGGLIFKPDVVIVNQLNETAVLGSLLATLTGCRSVVRLSAFGTYGNLAWARQRACPPVYLWALKRADAVIVSSQDYLDELRAEGLSEARIRIIPNMVGSATGASSQAVPSSWLWCGRLSAEKDPLLALKIIASPACPPDVRLVICGTGPLEEDLRGNMATLGLASRVTLKGFVEDPKELMARSGALLFTSHEDAMPNVILEAMASGLPVIATKTAGSCRLVEDGVTGLLAGDRNPETLVRLVARLAEDPDLARRLGEAGRRLAHERHSPESAMPQWHAAITGKPAVTIVS